MADVFPEFKKLVSREKKEERLKQRSKVIWFTGLSGSGKTTLATGLEHKLFELGYTTQVLDGDNVRSGINNNLTFTAEDRLENIRRISEVAKLIVNNGVICLCSFISPSEQIRGVVRNIVGENNLLMVHVNTPIEVCEKRDVKGLYKKARKGLIPNFTGIDAPFENPKQPFITINTAGRSLDDCIDELLQTILIKLQYV